MIERVKVKESAGTTLYMMANSQPALIALAQMGAIELHPFGSSAPKLDSMGAGPAIYINGSTKRNAISISLR